MCHWLLVGTLFWYFHTGCSANIHWGRGGNMSRWYQRSEVRNAPGTQITTDHWTKVEQCLTTTPPMKHTDHPLWRTPEARCVMLCDRCMTEITNCSSRDELWCLVRAQQLLKAMLLVIVCQVNNNKFVNTAGVPVYKVIALVLSDVHAITCQVSAWLRGTLSEIVHRGSKLALSSAQYWHFIELLDGEIANIEADPYSYDNVVLNLGVEGGEPPPPLNTQARTHTKPAVAQFSAVLLKQYFPNVFL